MTTGSGEGKTVVSIEPVVSIERDGLLKVIPTQDKIH